MPAAAKSRQSCLTPCDPIDGSPPGSPVPGILQAYHTKLAFHRVHEASRWVCKLRKECSVRAAADPTVAVTL